MYFVVFGKGGLGEIGWAFILLYLLVLTQTKGSGSFR